MNDSMAERHLVEQLNIIKNRQELIKKNEGAE